MSHRAHERHDRRRRLAGSEAAWQAASQGVPVTLHEMRPVRPTAVHKTDRLAELVCSNSFRGDKLDNAVGLLKEEMRRLGLARHARGRGEPRAGRRRAGRRSRAVRADRHRRASRRIRSSRSCAEKSTTIPESTERIPVILATGPLTSDALSADIARLVGQEHLYFYDAISPIVLAESIDRDEGVPRSRAGIETRRPHGPRYFEAAPASGRTGDAQADRPAAWTMAQGDYLNCPLTREEYERFYDALDPRGIGDGPRLRQGAFLRRLSADRSDGASRARTRCGSGR